MSRTKTNISPSRTSASSISASISRSNSRKNRDIFRREGAYRRFEDLLERKGALDAWYDFEEKAQTRALREWCEANGFEVTED